jgi:FKBP-type peptidyl-prolyl cis-trans isomerase
MKRLGFVIAVLAASFGTTKGQELKNTMDSAAYLLGNQYGEQFFTNQFKLNVDAFYAGLKDGYSGIAKIQEPNKSEVMKAFEQYIQSVQQEKSERDSRFNKEVAKSILERNRENKAIKETASGLQYEVIKEGTGAMPTATDRVEVHYEGTLFNGQKFDSSRDRGQPASFPLNQVIKGWTEGLQLMKEGSVYRFWIPSELGYGDHAMGNAIPAGSLLIFEVELIKVNP